MEHAPSINWHLAHRIAATRPADLPDLTGHELTMLVADLRVTARRAGELAARHLRVEGVGASRIKVVDWAGWGRAVQQMTAAAVAELGLEPQPASLRTRVAGARNGALLGLALRTISRRLLGQYDAFTTSGTLYLVAPSLLATERRSQFVPADFRLWVALHEQTHALQFRMAPWLRDHIAGRVRLVLDDEVSAVDGLLGWARTGDLGALFTSPEAGAALGDLNATMTFLEGHADFTSDVIARRHTRTVPAMRKAFARPEGTSILGRLSKSFDKNAQYRDGLAFCQRVQRLRNRSALRAAFAEPANLPTAAEIAEPKLWLDRVHG